MKAIQTQPPDIGHTSFVKKRIHSNMNKFNDVIILEMGSEKGPSARIIYFLVRVIEMTFALNSIAN